MEELNPLSTIYHMQLNESDDIYSQIALKSLEERGLPNTKWENWKYTQIQNHLPKTIEQTQKSAIKLETIKDLLSELIIDNKDHNMMVFINDELQSQYSKLEEGVTLSIESQKDEHKKNDPDVFSNINLAKSARIQKLNIKKDISTKPICIYHLYDNPDKESCLHERLEIYIEDHSQSLIVEYFKSININDKKTLRTHNTHCTLKPSSNLTYIKVIDEQKQICHISNTSAEVSKNANFCEFILPLYGDLTRCQLTAHLNAEGAHCTSNGLFVLKGKEHFDFFSNIIHKAPFTTSSQLYKGVLDDHSRGVFTGKIFIEKNCNGSSSEQLNKNLVVGEKAQINTRPQLEVYSDDVKCAHGATTGQLGEEELFYLKSRGIKEEQAYQMLTNGFIFDVINKVEDFKIKSFLIGKITQKLQRDFNV